MNIRNNEKDTINWSKSNGFSTQHMFQNEYVLSDYYIPDTIIDLSFHLILLSISEVNNRIPKLQKRKLGFKSHVTHLKAYSLESQVSYLSHPEF